MVFSLDYLSRVRAARESAHEARCEARCKAIIDKLDQMDKSRMLLPMEGTSDAGTRITLPKMAPNERYAGILLGRRGSPGHHVILLPGIALDVTWDQAATWAVKQGGDLPSRREQALLFANLRESIGWKTCFWSNRRRSGEGAFTGAYVQDFACGMQCGTTREIGDACAVRRVSIVSGL